MKSYTHSKFAILFHLGMLSALCAICITLSPNLANAKEPVAPLKESEIRSRYENCPSGFYNGPRPGKTSYIKDDYLWVVTPDFAKRFCMPPEFVSAELKGAEAVAMKLQPDHGQVFCHLENGKEWCGAKSELQFEILVSSTNKIPRLPDTPYYNPAPYGFSALLTASESEFQAGRIAPRPPGARASVRNLVGLYGIKDHKIAWPITTLNEEISGLGRYLGLDYYMFSGLSGFFRNERMEKLGITKFVIAFKQRAQAGQRIDGQTLAEQAHVIELPDSYSAKVREYDLKNGRNYEAAVDRIIGTPRKSTSSSAQK